MSIWLRGFDVAVVLLVIGFGALEVVLAQRSVDFYSGDTTYLELARSIVQRHWYGFNFRPETMIPPGFPALLAIFYSTLGSNREILVRVVSILSTLGLLVSYDLIKREESRAAAVLTCLLLMASPQVFASSTRVVFSDLPYLFTSMLTLAIAARLDHASNDRHRSVLMWLCGCALTASVLIRSAGITLCGGLLAWFAASWLRDKSSGSQRFKAFRIVLAVGLLSQALWMVWIHQNRPDPEWPLGGYPQHYLAQLTVKSGNQPELGSATAGDWAFRVARNLTARAAGVVTVATGKYFSNDWFALWVLLPLFLIAIGLCKSLWPSGGQLYDWYFVAHETMYLFWPWDFELRFLLPVAPLAFLYIWRGGRTVTKWAIQSPRPLTGWTATIATLCSMYGVLRGLASAADHVGLLFSPALRSPIHVAAYWTIVVGATACLCYVPTRLPVIPSGYRGHSFDPLKVACALVLTALVAVGFSTELRLGRENLHFDVTRDRSDYSQIVAAQWVRLHTPASSVIMARQMDVVYHYAQRKVVWFPPISDPDVLMRGIVEHHVKFVVVYDRGPNSYWTPAEGECFTRLSSAYPDAFRVVQQGPREQIFEIQSTAATHHGT